MDSSVKVMINIILIFIGIILLTSCVSFFMLATNARSVLYSVIQYVEIYGDDSEKIEAFANNTNTMINVSPIDITPLTGHRYKIDVSFEHLFGWLNLQKAVTYSGVTRMVEY